MFCPKCGSKLADDAKFCASCGAATGKAGGAPSAPEVPAAPPGPASGPRRRFGPVVAAVALALVVAGGAVAAWFAFFSPLDIDEENFPDAALRAHVAGALDADGDGKLSRDEGAAVTELSLEGATDLSGLGRAFPNLSSLTVTGGALASLDVGDLPRLAALDVRDEPLRSLDLSRNGGLSDVHVADSVALFGLAEAGLREEWVMTRMVVDTEQEEAHTTYDVRRDGDGRVTGVDCLSPRVMSATYEYGFDVQGRRASEVVTQWSGSSKWPPQSTYYAYDAEGRLAEESTQGGALVFRRSYDDAGRLAELTMDMGDVVNVSRYSYDGQGRLVSEENSYPKGEEQVFDYWTGYRRSLDYDGQGRCVRSYTEYDVGDNDRSETITYEYDGDNVVHVGCEEVWLASGEPVGAIGLRPVDYAYDDEGRIVSARASIYGGKAYEVEVAYDGRGNVALVHEVRNDSERTYRPSYARYVAREDERGPEKGLVLGVAVEPIDEISPSLVRLYEVPDPAAHAGAVPFSGPGSVLAYYM